MRMSPSELERLTDAQLKREVIFLAESAEDVPAPVAQLRRLIAAHLIREVKRRRRLILHFEAEMMNRSGPGSLVGPDDDPIGDALRELRGPGDSMSRISVVRPEVTSIAPPQHFVISLAALVTRRTAIRPCLFAACSRPAAETTKD